jgi:hypothetical protein
MQSSNTPSKEMEGDQEVKCTKLSGLRHFYENSFKDYAKGMYITVKISEKWEGIFKNWGTGSGLPNEVSSKPRWQFDGRHEITSAVKYDLRIGTVPI